MPLSHGLTGLDAIKKVANKGHDFQGAGGGKSRFADRRGTGLRTRSHQALAAGAAGGSNEATP